jgi:hypothetical protein
MWTFMLTDRVGNQLGEIRNATGRSLRFPLGRTPTLTFTVDAGHPFASQLITQDKVMVRAYDDASGTKTVRFVGPVSGYSKHRESGKGTISVAASGLQWRLDRRLIGKNIAGATDGTNALTLKDRGVIMGDILDAVNAGEASTIWADADNTGIRRGTITPSSTTYIGPLRYVTVSQVYSDLTSTLDGPDWQIRYSDYPLPSDAQGVILGYLDVSAALGQVQPNVVWAFGTSPHNVASWDDVGDATGLANLAVNLPPGYPDTSQDQPIPWSDATSIADRGLNETVVTADLQTADLRTRLVQGHVRVRKTPRRVISFVPVAEDPSAPIDQRRVPRFGVEFGLGDVMTFRAVERFPVTDAGGTVIGYTETPTVDVLTRCFVAQLDLDDNGVASTTLTLIQEN